MGRESGCHRLSGAYRIFLDRAAKTVTLENGARLLYDALVIATGSLVRQLPMFPAGMPGVHYLRTQQDAHTLRAVSDAGERMPQKTTYFYPKVPAGLVIRSLDDD